MKPIPPIIKRFREKFVIPESHFGSKYYEPYGYKPDIWGKYRDCVELEQFIQEEVQAAQIEVLKEAIDLITTHTEHNGNYCDTGGDMEWKCRSECVEMAVSRLQSLVGKEVISK